MPTGVSESIATVSELPHPASPDPTTPVLRLVEWIASDRESGVLRLRGDLPAGGRSLTAAPVLVLRDETGSLTQRSPLNEGRPDADGWRAAYLIAGALLGRAVEKWLEWPDGTRLAVPDVDVSAGDGRIPAPPPEHGAEVFDRAVLAERRAQRAESAQRAQARTAEAAVAALGALERRVEELTRERDALAEAQAQPASPDAETASPVRLVVPAPDGRGTDSSSEPPHTDLSSELELARAARREAEQSERRHREALDEALGTLGRLRVRVAELRLRMRVQMASASADAVRLTVLEGERRGFRARLHDLRAEIDGLQARLAGEQAQTRRLASELERARADVAGIRAERGDLRAALFDEREARARAERDLGAERAARQALAARTAELEASSSDERSRLHAQADALRRRVEGLDEQLRAERSARASLMVQLRVARSSESAARAEAAARTAAQSKLRREHAEALAQAAAARSELVAARQAAAAPPAREPARGEANRPQRRLAELEAELADTRAALEAARGRLRRAADAASGAATDAPESGGGTEPGSTPVSAGHDEAEAAEATPAPQAGRPALSADVAASLRRRIASIQSAASVAVEPAGQWTAGREGSTEPDVAGLAARLDAAAASLRAAVPDASLAGVPAREEAGAQPPASLREAPPAAPLASLSLTVRAPAEVVVAERAVTDVAPGSGTRRMPALRGALVRLAAEDPFTAARLMAALLPAQGAFLREDVDYDLTIRELGTFSVTVAGGRTSVRALLRPRPRREAQMHLTVHALTLAELLAGRPRRVGRLLAPVRLRGSRRALDGLAVLAQEGPRLADVARAGAVLEPALLARVLPHLVDAADTEGHSFTVAHEIVDQTVRTWYLTADGRRGLRVSTSPSGGACDARVTMSRATFDSLLRAEPLESRHKPWIRGDFTAVETLRRWIDAAQR